MTLHLEVHWLKASGGSGAGASRLGFVKVNLLLHFCPAGVFQPVTATTIFLRVGFALQFPRILQKLNQFRF